MISAIEDLEEKFLNYIGPVQYEKNFTRICLEIVFDPE